MVTKIIGSVILIAVMSLSINSIIKPEQATKDSFGFFYRFIKPTEKDVKNTKVSGYVGILFCIYFLYFIWIKG